MWNPLHYLQRGGGLDQALGHAASGTAGAAGGWAKAHWWQLLWSGPMGTATPPAAVSGALGGVKALAAVGWKGLFLAGAAGLAIIGGILGLVSKGARKLHPVTRTVSRIRNGRAEAVSTSDSGGHGGGLLSTVKKTALILLLFIALTPYTLSGAIRDGKRLGTMIGPSAYNCGPTEQPVGGATRLASDLGHAVHHITTAPPPTAQQVHDALTDWAARAGQLVAVFRNSADGQPTPTEQLPPAEQVAAPCCAVGPGPGSLPAAYRPVQGPGAAGLTAEQTANARRIIAVGKSLQVPARGQVVALAAALQESGLRNLPGGDRDSAGLFQQRPSQGWGTWEQVTDPTHAATAFYMHLLAVPGWPGLPVTAAAQAVQASAHPDAYTDDEALARQLVGLYGGTPAARLEAVADDGCAAPAVPSGVVTAGSPQVEAAIAFARAQLGEPYLYGAEGPDAWDCSGLIDGAFGLAGRPTTAELITMGSPVAPGAEQRGDLLFFDDGGHVALALGDGTAISAPHAGAVVRVGGYRTPMAVRRLGPTTAA